MERISEFKTCKCGYSIIVYASEKPSRYHYIDGHSGNYEQTYVCPGCHDRLDYMTLEG